MARFLYRDESSDAAFPTLFIHVGSFAGMLKISFVGFLEK